MTRCATFYSSTPLSAQEAPDDVPSYREAKCAGCGKATMARENEQPRCIACTNFRIDGPFSGISFRLEVGSEDSRDPRRVQDRTAGLNLGLPPVETVVGTRRDGKPKIATRPVTNNEVATGRARQEYAQRHGLTAVEKKTYRSIGR